MRNGPHNGIAPVWDAALIFLAVVAFVVVATGWGDSNIQLRSFDFGALFSYQLDFYRASLLDGRLPLWNAYTFSGWPFLANPQSGVFYPGSLLFLWLPQSQALSIELTVHLLLAAAGTYALARMTLGTSRGAAILAALIFALCGALFARVLFGHRLLIMSAAYIPLLATVIDQAVVRSRSWLWFGGLLLALQILAGGLPMVWLGMIFIGLWRLTVIVVRSPLDWNKWFREGLTLGFVIALGMSLAAVQLVPSTELSGLSNRPDHDFTYASYGSYDPGFLTTFFQRVDVASSPDWWWGHYSFIGLLPLALAVIGLILAVRRRHVIGLAVTGVFLWLFMLGKNGFLLRILFDYIPTFDLFRHSSRALILVHLIVALLAAVGLDKILHGLRLRLPGIGWIAPATVILVCLVSWTDLTTAARWYTERAFVADRWDPDNPAQIHRTEILAGDQSWYRVWFNRGLFRQNHALRVGAHSIDGYDVMMPDRYQRFIHAMTDTPAERQQLTHISSAIFITAPSPFPFKILGVKYADVPGRILIRPDPSVFARAWFVDRIRAVTDEAAALRYMRSRDFQPFREVLFETAEVEQLGPASVLGAGETDLTTIVTDVFEDIPERLRIDVAPHPPGYLVLSEMYYPGWRAEIDGVELPVYRCNSVLRCLRLDGSKKPIRITMEFRPTSLKWGAVISIVSLALTIGGVWFGALRSRVS